LDRVCLPTVGICGIVGNLSAIAIYRVCFKWIILTSTCSTFLLKCL
jgi:hypothetical protein